MPLTPPPGAVSSGGGSRGGLGTTGGSDRCGGPPAWALPGLVIDLDATVVVCHSEKEQAVPTFKRSFGYHPMVVFLYSTAERWPGCCGRASSIESAPATSPASRDITFAPGFAPALLIHHPRSGSTRVLIPTHSHQLLR